MTGRIHSVQSLGAVDGPGLRGVVFFQGCPLRCAYCHNPDTWGFEGGRETDVEALVKRLLRCRSYYNNGGVTASGGEPLMQNRFLLEVMELVAPGTHILIESSGHCDRTAFLAAVKKASYVYFGVKLLNEQESLSLTGKSCRTALENLMLLDQTCSTPYAFRIPFLHGITDRKEYLLELAGLCSQLKRLEKIYFLPSNKNAGAKYASCGRVFSSCYDVNYRCTLPDDITFPVPVETL